MTKLIDASHDYAMAPKNMRKHWLPLLLLLLLLLLIANWFILCGNVLQCKTGQYSRVDYDSVQYNAIKPITHDNIRHSRQPTTFKITKNNQEHKKSLT
jgi:hypothetical protein